MDNSNQDPQKAEEKEKRSGKDRRVTDANIFIDTERRKEKDRRKSKCEQCEPET